MDFNEIRKLVKLVEASAISSLEVEEGELSIRIEKHTLAPAPLQPAGLPGGYAPAPAPVYQMAPAAAPPAPATASHLLEVKAPMVGTFYRSPGPDKEPFVKVGDMIAPGKTLCILEAMKIMNEIEAELSGRVVEILVENGQPVQFDQVLFRIEP
ncbi:MAG: acetyl-CoA carboxylase biotin carboxyl carrier protein [Candidatus Delongbacteria bacterium]